MNFAIAADYVQDSDGHGIIWADPVAILFQEEPEDAREVCRALVFAPEDGGFEIGYATDIGIKRLHDHRFDSRSQAQFTARKFARDVALGAFPSPNECRANVKQCLLTGVRLIGEILPISCQL